MTRYIFISALKIKLPIQWILHPVPYHIKDHPIKCRPPARSVQPSSPNSMESHDQLFAPAQAL